MGYELRKSLYFAQYFFDLNTNMEESSSQWEYSCDKCTSKFRTSLLTPSFFPSISMALQSSTDLHLLSGLLTVSSVFWPLFPICHFAFFNIISNILPPPIGLTTLKYLNCSRKDGHCIYGTETFHGTVPVMFIQYAPWAKLTVPDDLWSLN
jgi:hypothetical protein